MIHFGWTGENRPQSPGLTGIVSPGPFAAGLSVPSGRPSAGLEAAVGRSRSAAVVRPVFAAVVARPGSAAVVRPEFAAVVARPGSAAVVRFEFAAVVARPGSAAVVDRFESSPCPDGRVWAPAGITLPLSDSSDTGTLSGSPLPASSVSYTHLTLPTKRIV